MSIWNPFLNEAAPLLGGAGLFTGAPKFRELRLRYAWSIPNEEAGRAIAEVSPNGVVDIGAGGNYWGRFLRQFGVDVAAFDTGGQTKASMFQGQTDWAEVLPGGPEQAGLYPQRTLMLGWPTATPATEAEIAAAGGQKLSFAVEAFRCYRESGGRSLVYVGVAYWEGAEADEMSDAERILGWTFVEPHAPFPSDWALVREIEIPWFDTNRGQDKCFIFTRR